MPILFFFPKKRCRQWRQNKGGFMRKAGFCKVKKIGERQSYLTYLAEIRLNSYPVRFKVSSIITEMSENCNK